MQWLAIMLLAAAFYWAYVQYRRQTHLLAGYYRNYNRVKKEGGSNSAALEAGVRSMMYMEPFLNLSDKNIKSMCDVFGELDNPAYLGILLERAKSNNSLGALQDGKDWRVLIKKLKANELANNADEQD